MAKQYLVNFNSHELSSQETEVLVVGTGIAGLFTAWKAAQTGARVTILTKKQLADSNTAQAQGGIAAVLGEGDSEAGHIRDTLAAGAGLCEDEAVKTLVTEGPARIRELIEIGVCFDYAGGRIALTREGGHSCSRVLHARGDATGAELIRALSAGLAGRSNVELLENRFVVDLLVKDGVCYGVLAQDCSSGELSLFRSRAVVLATGGAGQLYSYTTNPEVATADGVALAYRAGAEVMDMEFVQFHPTALAILGAPCFLISEAVRGEGGVLRNAWGERFMPGYHSMAELAPRDIVARAILAEMRRTGGDKVYLDLTCLPPEKVKRRFPTITATCRQYGLDVTGDLIPVAPAAHYLMGGVRINLWGQTSIERLFCCGEASCPGVHGANRLASNSLLDGLVFGARIARRVAEALKYGQNSCPEFGCSQLKPAPPTDFVRLRSQLRQIMGQKVGPLRTAQGLTEALDFFDSQQFLNHCEMQDPLQMELRNMLTAGRLTAEAALMRTESRGGHFRWDFPESVERWRKHILIKGI